MPRPDPDTGVVFPRGEDGRRSTTTAGRAVLADALRAVDPAGADAVEAEKDWRSGYLRHVVALTAAGARSAPAAVAVARAGLASVGTRMALATGGEERPLGTLLPRPSSELATEVVQGRGPRQRELVLPYRGEQLRGDALLRRLEQWEAAGTVEPSCAAILSRLVAEPERLELSGRAVAVLGAGAEMGPLGALASWGASVVAVDVPSAKVWTRVLALAEAGAGTVTLPVRPGPGDLAGRAGADLLTSAPEIAAWLTGVAPGRTLTVGSHAYADGADHVRVAAAGDAVIASLLGSRPGTGYAELATPTDAFVVPQDVVDDSRRRWAARGWRSTAQKPLQLLTRGALYAPAYTDEVPTDDGRRVGVADVLVPQQGPNYALAKRLQRWRAVVAKDDGVQVSANVAPATRTRSVTSNRLLAAAYSGAGRFGVEVFEPETSRVLMAALLAADLTDPDAAGAPGRALAHPDDLFVEGAAHGGLWRVPYSPRSVLGLAAGLGAPAMLRRG